MPALADDLTVWEIGLRWAGGDPYKTWLHIPFPAKDYYRILMDAIIKGELYCLTLSLEKPGSREGLDPQFTIYRYLDDVYACIAGAKFNRKMLKEAVIDRFDFKTWCECRGIPLPEFWFPSGWKLDFEYDEKIGLPGYRQLGAGTPEDCDSLGTETVGEVALRDSQEARIACRRVARVIWKENPNLLIKEVVEHEVIQKYCDAGRYVHETVHDWVKDLAPLEARKPGRRPNK